MRSGTVSVIIPNYNQTQYITNAILSALNQTSPPREVIVVDDGSTDNSWEVISEFGDQVRYIRQENKGLAGARNTGILASRGSLIGLLDADDEWMPHFLETMLALVDSHPDAAVYYSATQAIDEVGDILPRQFGGPAREPRLIYETLLRANFLIPSAIILRRSVLDSVGLFDEELRSCEDWDLWLRMLPKHAFVGTSQPLAYYRLHSRSLSADPIGMQTAAREVAEKHLGLEDGEPAHWSWEKRRLFGGVYRYHLLTSVQRQGDWEKGVGFMRRALQIDPALAKDLDLFYDLALGSQAQGFRGTSQGLELEKNATRINQMLASVFDLTQLKKNKSLRADTFGTAHFALALVAYNMEQLSLSRQFGIRALRFRPDLFRNGRLMGNLIKSLTGYSGLRLMRWIRGSFAKLAHN